MCELLGYEASEWKGRLAQNILRKLKAFGFPLSISHGFRISFKQRKSGTLSLLSDKLLEADILHGHLRALSASYVAGDHPKTGADERAIGQKMVA